MNIFPFFDWLKKRPDASSLYQKIVTQARRPEFYRNLGIPDTASGRFDMISLHAFILMKRLKSDEENGRDLSQALFDFMFDDMDKNLREMGVGDIAVGKKVKILAAAYYGRITAYEKGLQSGEGVLEEVFQRNLYCDGKPSREQLTAMVHYFRGQIKISEDWTFEQISQVNFAFLPPPKVGG